MKSVTLSCTILIALLPSIRAQSLEDYQALLDNSPFLSKAFKDRMAHGKATGMNAYTFTGYTQFDDTWKLCFVHKKEGTAIWAGVGESVGDFKISRFDPEIQAVTLERGGVSNTITMDKPKQ